MNRLVLGIVTVLGLIAAGAADAAVFLKRDTTVNGEYIMLSDLFDGISKEEDRRVAAAPAPAKRSTFDAATLSSLARRYNLAWQPASEFDRISVARAYKTVSADEIMEAVRKAGGLDEDTVLDTRMFIGVNIPVDISYEIQVNDVSFDEKSRSFRADVSIVSEGSVIEAVRPVGRMSVMVSVPVLRRNLTSGMLIREADIDYAKVNSDSLKQKSITDESVLVGKEARRSLKAGQIIGTGDIRTPVLVNKSKPVNIVFRRKNMTLTSVAKALDSGGMGDAVRFQAQGSTNIMQGVVVDHNTIMVGMDFANETNEGL